MAVRVCFERKDSAAVWDEAQAEQMLMPVFAGTPAFWGNGIMIDVLSTKHRRLERLWQVLVPASEDDLPNIVERAARAPGHDALVFWEEGGVSTRVM